MPHPDQCTHPHVGFCDGGPFDGRRMQMRGTRHRVSILDALGPIEASHNVMDNEGTYTWHEPGIWRWKGDNARAQKR